MSAIGTFKTDNRFNKNKMVQLFGLDPDHSCKTCKHLTYVIRKKGTIGAVTG